MSNIQMPDIVIPNGWSYVRRGAPKSGEWYLNECLNMEPTQCHGAFPETYNRTIVRYSAEDVIDSVCEDHNLDLMSKWKDLGTKLGETVAHKNRCYGDAHIKTGEILEILYPHGIPKCYYHRVLLMVRICDKLCRISVAAPEDVEDPFMDIAGYGLLGAKT